MFVVCFLLIKMQQFIYIFPNHVILQIDLISWFFISKIGIFYGMWDHGYGNGIIT